MYERRQRRAREGEMLQLDGSPHDRLQGRGPRLTLLGYQDDATGKVVAAEFFSSEESIGYFRLLRRILHERIVSNDNMVQWQGRRFQIPPQPRRFSFAGAKVQLYQALDRRVSLYYGDTRLDHTPLGGDISMLLLG